MYASDTPLSGIFLVSKETAYTSYIKVHFMLFRVHVILSKIQPALVSMNRTLRYLPVSSLLCVKPRLTLENLIGAKQGRMARICKKSDAVLKRLIFSEQEQLCKDLLRRN
jgi:hypothetical protein